VNVFEVSTNHQFDTCGYNSHAQPDFWAAEICSEIVAIRQHKSEEQRWLPIASGLVALESVNFASAKIPSAIQRFTASLVVR